MTQQKLTPAHRDVLAQISKQGDLAVNPRLTRKLWRTCTHLANRGLAEQVGEARLNFFTYRITDAGRKALSDGQEAGG